MARITASRAKGEYGLTDDDLDALGCECVRNPHYRSAPPMRLYDLADVESAAEAKRAARPALLAAAAAAREQEAARRRGLALAAREAAKARVAAFVRPRPAEAGSTPLPVHLWTSVLESLRGLCDAQLRGPTTRASRPATSAARPRRAATCAPPRRTRCTACCRRRRRERRARGSRRPSPTPAGWPRRA